MNIKSFLSLGIFTVASVSMAGGFGHSHSKAMQYHVRHGYKLPAVKAAYLDTRTIPIQINSHFRLTHEMPENPTPPLKWMTGIGSASSVPVGAATIKRDENVLSKFPGIGPTGWVPPDPNIAAGPAYLVESVNSTVAFFKKSDGTMTFSQDFQTFFQPLNTGSFLFDPKVMYDKVSGRFFFLADEQDTGSQTAKIDLAVSKTSDPNGGWYEYRIEAKQTLGGNTFWLDYPSLATSTAGIVVTGNMFPFSGGGFGGVQFIVIPKAPTLNGGTVTPTSLQDPNLGSAQVARNWETAQTDIYALALSSNSSMRVYDIQSPTSNPTLQYVDVAIPNFTGSQNVAHSIGGTGLDTLGDRIFNVYERNGHLVTGHSVQSNSNTANAKWYQFGINNWPSGAKQPALIQSGQISTSPGDDTWLPALDENINGDISVVFSRSNPNVGADIMLSTRLNADPLGQTTFPKKLGGSGTTPYTSYRWGDFFDIAIDPLDGTTFWGVEMVIDNNGNWQTEFYSWTTSGNVNGAGNPYPPTSVTTLAGTYVSGNAASLANVDNNSYLVFANLVPRLGNVATIETTYVVQPAPKSVVQLVYDVAPVQGVTLLAYAYNYVTRNFDLISTQAMTSTKKVIVNINNYANYIDPSGNMKVIMRAVAPSHVGVSRVFYMKTDQAIISAQ